MTLIQIQEQAIEKLDVTRTSVRRYAKLRNSVAKWYVNKLTSLGYTTEQAFATWQDVKDMSVLQQIADNAGYPGGEN